MPKCAQRGLLHDVLGGRCITRQVAGKRIGIVQQGLYEVTESVGTGIHIFPHRNQSARGALLFPEDEKSHKELMRRNRTGCRSVFTVAVTTASYHRRPACQPKFRSI